MNAYHVTYYTFADATEDRTRGLDGEAELDEVIENCRTLDLSADLFDEAGFRRGWVHSDGTYTLS